MLRDRGSDLLAELQPLVVRLAAVPDKGNELKAIRQLLAELEGRVVSIDVMGCRADVARTMAAAGGRYLPAVKDNEFDLYAHLQRDFAYLDRSETVEWRHGRLERHPCTIMGGAPLICRCLETLIGAKATLADQPPSVAGFRTAMGGLAEPVATFFAEVMVMVEDADLRAHRLGLMERVACLGISLGDLVRLRRAIEP